MTRSGHPSAECTPPDADGPRPLRADGGGDLREAHHRAVADALSTYDRVLEVGIGTRPGVAARLAARGVDVVAVDTRPVGAPDGVRFVRADVADLAPGDHRDREAVYALRLPPDLQATVARLARSLDADCAFTTLGTDPVTVPTRPARVPGGTLHRLRDARGER